MSSTAGTSPQPQDSHAGPLPDVAVPKVAVPDVAVIVPAHDEAQNLPDLLAEIAQALRGIAHEVIVVDDGSHDDTRAVLNRLKGLYPALRMLRHARKAGQSAALRSGLLAARAPVIVTIDGDGQNDPSYIPALIERLATGSAGLGLVAGQREKRKDGWAKSRASRFANALRGAVLKDGTRDTGCGLKALRRDVFVQLPFFDGWHRYLPALVIREGLTVTHLSVVDRPRLHGRSKYGIVDRGLRGVLDLAGVWWLCHRARPVSIKHDEEREAG